MEAITRYDAEPEHRFVVKMIMQENPLQSLRGLVSISDKAHTQSLGHHGYHWEGDSTPQFRKQMGEWHKGRGELVKFFWAGYDIATQQMLVSDREVPWQDW